MQIIRARERFIVDIPIIVTTVLDSLEGTIVDLSEGGAQVVGCSLPVKSQCQIDLDGHIVFGTVRWTEVDRMGIRFPYELHDGPLFEALENIRSARRASIPFQPRRAAAIAAPAPVVGFGRRSA